MARPRDEDADRAAFERAMADVRRTPRGNERAPRVKPRPVAHAPDTALLLREEDGGGYRAHDVSRALLRELRRGRLAIDRELDLHGHTARQAVAAVTRAVEEAHAAGASGLRIIHGRGRHSPEAPVLGDRVIDALLHPPLLARVAAIAPAPPRLGGSGATLVWLRRARRGP